MRVYIFNKLPGDIDAAHLKTTLWVARAWNTKRSNECWARCQQVESVPEMCLENESYSVMSDSWPHGPCSPWNSPGQNTVVDSLSLLQGIFPTQGSNPGFPHCRWILYQLSHKGSTRILEWVAYPFSRGSSQPRNWTGVSCIAGEFFANWAIREVWNVPYYYSNEILKCSLIFI